MILLKIGGCDLEPLQIFFGVITSNQNKARPMLIALLVISQFSGYPL